MVVFKVDSRSYALPIDRVQEIQQLVEVTPLPDTSKSLVGLVNLRGRVIPAIDFRLLVGIPQLPYTLETLMIISRTGSELVALIVDEVQDVVVLPDGCLQEPARVYALADRMIGMCKLDDDLVFLLDVERLVPADEITSVTKSRGGGEDS